MQLGVGTADAIRCKNFASKEANKFRTLLSSLFEAFASALFYGTGKRFLIEEILFVLPPGKSNAFYASFSSMFGGKKAKTRQIPGMQEMPFHVVKSGERSAKHHKTTPCGVSGKFIEINDGFVRAYNLLHEVKNNSFPYEVLVINLSFFFSSCEKSKL